jgi:hypothetical protein
LDLLLLRQPRRRPSSALLPLSCLSLPLLPCPNLLLPPCWGQLPLLLLLC